MKARAMDLNGVPQLPALVGVMVLLDQSGSMKSIQASMEAAFADVIKTQKEFKPDGMWLTLRRFDSDEAGNLRYQVGYDRTPLDHVGGLGLKPRGGTPLRDALYRFAHEARAIIDDPNDPTERLLVIIITDGEENMSRTYNWDQVREVVEGLKGEDCEVIWMGTSAAIMEAVGEIPVMAGAGSTVAYTVSAAGSHYVGENTKLATSAFRMGVSGQSVSSAYMAVMDEQEATKTTMTSTMLRNVTEKMRAGKNLTADDFKEQPADGTPKA